MENLPEPDVSENEIFVKLQNSEESSFIKQLIEYSRDIKDKLKGKFEGLNLEHEDIANELLRSYNCSSGWRMATSVGIIANRNSNVSEKITRTHSLIKQMRLWWNPDGAHMFSNIKERNLTRNGSNTKLLQEALVNQEQLFSWIVSPPGMGKTVLTMQLEEDWRKRHPKNRLIVRLEMRHIQNQKFLENPDKIQSNSFTVKPFLKRFAPFIPLEFVSDFLSQESLDVFIILDGFDEIASEYENKWLDILDSLTQSHFEADFERFTEYFLRRGQVGPILKLKRVFLTTRPRLEETIKMKLNSVPYYLVPFTKEDQREFIFQEVKEVMDFSLEQAKQELELLPPVAQSLTETPLLTFMLAQYIKLKGEGCSSEVSNSFDLYEKFIRAQYTRYIQKQCVSYENESDTISRRQHEEALFQKHLPYYYDITIRAFRPRIEFLWPYSGKIEINIINNEILEELAAIGLVRREETTVSFWHQSFVEFFYARTLIDKNTTLWVGSRVLRHICSSNSLEGVEDFVVSALKQPNISCSRVPLRACTNWLEETFCVYDNIRVVKFSTFTAVTQSSAVFVFSGVLLASALKSRGIQVCHLITQNPVVSKFNSIFLSAISILGFGNLGLCTSCAAGICSELLRRVKHKNINNVLAIISCLPFLGGIWAFFGNERILTLRQCILASWFGLSGIFGAKLLKRGHVWFRPFCFLLGLFLSGVYSGRVVKDTSFCFSNAHYSAKDILENFISSKLFPFCGDFVLHHCVKLDNKELMEVVKQGSIRIQDHHARKWLSNRDFSWVCQNLLLTSEADRRSKSSDDFDLAVKVLCSNVDYFVERLNPVDIFTFLVTSKDFIAIITQYTNSTQQRTKIIEKSGVTPKLLKEIMLTSKSLISSLNIAEVAWWIAENFTKSELVPYFANPDKQTSDIVGKYPSRVEIVWGEEFLGDVLNFEFKLDTQQNKNVFEGEGRYFVIDKFWERIKTNELCALGLKQALLNSGDWNLVKYLESRYIAEHTCLDNDNTPSANTCHILCILIQNLCDKPYVLSFESLPFFICYGNYELFSKHVFKIPKKISNYRILTSMLSSLIISVMADNTDATYEFVVQNIKSSGWINPIVAFTQMFRDTYMGIMLSFGASYIRRISKMIWKDIIPPIFEICLGEVTLRLIFGVHVESRIGYFTRFTKNVTPGDEEKGDPMVLNLKISEVYKQKVTDAAGDVLYRCTCCEDLNILRKILPLCPWLKPFLYDRLVYEYFLREHQGYSPLSGRFRCLFHFYLQIQMQTQSLDKISSNESLFFFKLAMKCEVEVNLSDTKCECLLQAVVELSKNKHNPFISTDKLCVKELLKLFPSFRSEAEWKVVIQILSGSKTKLPRPSRSELEIYTEPVTPLLRVWLELNGRENTKAVVEDNCLWREIIDQSHYHYTLRNANQNPHTFLHKRLHYHMDHYFDVGGVFGSTKSHLESVLLAVELGSLQMLKRLGRPSLLLWKNTKDENLLDIARSIWGEDNEVTKFLDEKFQLRFMQANQQ